MERWKPVAGYPRYMVSDLGRVYSWVSEKFLRPGIASHGYPTVTLSPPRGTRTVHSLVAEAFIGPCPDGMEVRHENGIRTDPRLSNILYGTPTQNRKDQYRHGTRTKESDVATGRKTRDTKLAHNPNYFIESNSKGVETKDARYGREWAALSFAGVRYAKP